MSSISSRVLAASLLEIARAEFVDGDLGDDDAASATESIALAVAKKNQFVGFDPSFEKAISREMTELFETRDVARAKNAIAAIMKSALGDPPREVTAASYSAELQLAILGLQVDSMSAPILDIGCGADAALVRFLRAKGKDARGVDRECPTDLVSIGAGARADWLAFDYGKVAYGTITSHLGFSLHFMHQEMKRSDLAFEYARAYMRIVQSLAPGGTFSYVPGLPFIEAMLPRAQIEVTTKPLARDLVTENVARVQEATSLVLDAATHVHRKKNQ